MYALVGYLYEFGGLADQFEGLVNVVVIDDALGVVFFDPFLADFGELDFSQDVESSVLSQ